MARIFIDGFEAGNTNLWVDFGTETMDSAAYGMTGNYMLRSNSGHYLQKAIGTQTALYGAFRMNTWGANGDQPIFKFFDGATVIGSIRYNPSNNRIQAYRGNTATLLASSPTSSILNYITYSIEFKYVPNNTTGIFQVKINGVLQIDYSGNTVAGSETSLNQVELRGAYYGGQYHYYDDIVLDDANWIGNTRIYGLSPSGAGTNTNWTPSSGNNYETVDEVPPSDADYNYVNSVDQVDTFAMANLPFSPETIKCVQVGARAQKEGASTPQNIALALYQGSTVYPGSDQALETSFKSFVELWETDPDTASAWTESGVNALEAGYKSRT